MHGKDPVVTNPGPYRVVMENERVRVLEYTDQPATVRIRMRIPTA